MLPTVCSMFSIMPENPSVRGWGRSRARSCETQYTCPGRAAYSAPRSRSLRGANGVAESPPPGAGLGGRADR